jgi:hypothetical protein
VPYPKRLEHERIDFTVSHSTRAKSILLQFMDEIRDCYPLISLVHLGRKKQGFNFLKALLAWAHFDIYRV